MTEIKSYIAQRSINSIHETTVNYLETIYELENKIGKVKSADIHRRMNIARPTVSARVKNLSDNGYITIDTNMHIHLTTLGKDMVLQLHEKFECLYIFLITIGVKEGQAHEDANKLKHCISGVTFECIKTFYEAIRFR